jgi:DNA-binding Lrp family transcriptional regulator
MIQAYVLVALTEDANPSDLASELTTFPEVDNLHLIYGSWDLVIYVQVADMGKLRQFSLNKLLKIPGVSKTNTLIVADEE